MTFPLRWMPLLALVLFSSLYLPASAAQLLNYEGGSPSYEYDPPMDTQSGGSFIRPNSSDGFNRMLQEQYGGSTVQQEAPSAAKEASLRELINQEKTKLYQQPVGAYVPAEVPFNPDGVAPQVVIPATGLPPVQMAPSQGGTPYGYERPIRGKHTVRYESHGHEGNRGTLFSPWKEMRPTEGNGFFGY